jgi:hypothetical protein
MPHCFYSATPQTLNPNLDKPKHQPPLVNKTLKQLGFGLPPPHSSQKGRPKAQLFKTGARERPFSPTQHKLN